MKVAYPGLNAPLDTSFKTEPVNLVEQDDEEKKSALNIIRTRLEARDEYVYQFIVYWSTVHNICKAYFQCWQTKESRKVASFGARI